MSQFDRSRVGRSFHDQAAVYDRHSSVQKRVVARLMSLVNNHVHSAPERILDVGCGTGQLLSSFHSQYPHSVLCGVDLAYNMAHRSKELLGNHVQMVNGDAEHLPYREGSFDVVVSTSTLQWLDSLDIFFQQAFRVTAKNGLLCVAFFGEGTLCELRECLREVVEHRVGSAADYLDRLHRFKDCSNVTSALEKTEYIRPVIMRDLEIEYYDDLYDLLRSIKRIGAGASVTSGRQGGLGWKGILAETSRLYSQRYGSGGNIPATYEVVYVMANR